MKELLVMRHAKSSWSNSGLADIDRPLNRRGKLDAAKMAQHLSSLDLIPQAISSSSSKRTRQTVAGLIEVWGEPPHLQFLRSFYHGDGEDFLPELAKLPEDVERAMVVGHNPGVEMFVEDLGGEYERMPTAAVALFYLAVNSWAELQSEFEAELKNYWTPKSV